MKRALASLFLGIVMLVTGSGSSFVAFADTASAPKTNSASKISHITDDSNFTDSNSTLTESIDYKQMEEEAKVKGNDLKIYSTEEEYLNSQKISSAQIVDYSFDTQEAVKQIITVMTTATGSKVNGNYVESKPVQNAIVRINGVPRYTNSSGQIQVTMQKNSYVELFVEKEGYNPYIEIMEVTGEEKIIHIKQPSDDIDIYGVMLYYDGESINLLNQNYSIDKAEKPYDENFTFEIFCTVQIEQFKIYQDNEVKFSSLENSDKVTYGATTVKWEGQNFSDYFDVGGNIVVEVFYEGIDKKEELYLSFINVEEIDIGGIFNNTDKFNAEFGDPIFGSFEIDIANAMIKSLYVDRKNGFGLNFGIIHDNKEMVTKISIGFNFSRDLKGTKQKDQRIYDSFRRSYDACRNLHGQGMFEALQKAFMCPGLISNASGIKSPNLGFNLSFNLQIIGYIEIYDEQFQEEKLGAKLGEEYIKAIGLNIMGGLSLDWVWNSSIYIPPVLIPYYITFGFGVSLGSDIFLEFQNGIHFMAEFIVNVYAKLGLGLGVGKICGIDLYGKFDFYCTVLLTDYGVKCQLDFVLGLEGTILLFNFDIPLWKPDSLWHEEWGYYKEQLQTVTLSKSVNRYSLELLYEEDNNLGSEPQIIDFDNKKIKVWLGNDNSGDIYNSQKLFYCVENEGNWSKRKKVFDSMTNDFSPQIIEVDDNVYLTWTKSNVVYNENTTLSEMCGSQEIYFAKFDMATETFIDIQRLTNDTKFDATPVFVKSKNDLKLIWQSNSQNDPFGLLGSNSIYLSSYDKDGWSKPEAIISIDKPILNYDSTMFNEKLLLAYELDEDGDLFTDDDRSVYLLKNNETIKLNASKSANPRFMISDDSLKVLFMQNQQIVSINDFDTLNISYECDFTTLTDKFEVHSIGYTKIISYLEPTASGNNDLHIYLYDEINKSWNRSFVISNNQNIKNYSLVGTNNGLYFVSEDAIKNDSGETLYTVLSEVEYSFKYDITLEDIIFLDILKIGENTAYLTVVNNGSFEINEMIVSGCGSQQKLSFDSPLYPKESRMISFNFNVNEIKQEETFSISLLQNEDNISDNSKIVNTMYCDISLNIYEVYNNGLQCFNVKLFNNLNSTENVRVIARKCGQFGEIIYSSEWMALQGELEFNIQLDYINIGLEVNEMLYFELQTDNAQFIEQYSIHYVDKKTELGYNFDVLGKLDLLEHAKSLLI